MTPTLKILWEEPQQDRLHGGSRQIRERCGAYLEQIEQTLGVSFTDAFTEAIDREREEILENAYEQGFLTAFRLWMDAVAWVSPQG